MRQLEVSKRYAFVMLSVLGDPKCNFSQYIKYLCPLQFLLEVLEFGLLSYMDINEWLLHDTIIQWHPTYSSRNML